MTKSYQVRTRYRAPLVEGTLQVAGSSKSDATYSAPTLHIALSDKIRAITPGQSAVIYDGERVIGGGIVV